MATTKMKADDGEMSPFLDCFCLRSLVTCGMFTTFAFCNFGHCLWAEWSWFVAVLGLVHRPFGVLSSSSPVSCLSLSACFLMLSQTLYFR